MNFIFILNTALIVFTLSISIVFVIRMILNAIRKKQQPSIFILLCIVLSISIICFVVILVFVPNPRDYLIENRNYIFFVIICVLGILCGLKPSVFFPVYGLIICIFGFVLTLLLTKTLGSQKKQISVTVNKSEIIVENKTVPIISDEELKVNFTVFVLKDEVLLPISRVWYVPISFDKNTFTNNDLLINVMNFLLSNLFEAQENINVSLPVSEFFPSLFIIEVQRNLTQIIFTPHKLL